MRLAVLGAGLVGRRAAAFGAQAGADVLLISSERHVAPLEGVQCQVGVGSGTASLDGVDVAILATESMDQVALAEWLLGAGLSVVSTADQPEAVRALWELGSCAEANDVTLVVGAGCSPGLSSLLVAQLAAGLDSVDTITTARFGTGGPTCAREHHRSMSAPAWEVRDGDGSWVRGGTGRTLVWFPEPAGPQDCYRAGLSEPFLLQQAFPQARRIQSLQASTRRDRATARLPMLRPPHPEGLVGAVWVEVRGSINGRVEHRVMGASAPQATAAAAVAHAVAQDLVNTTSSFSGRRSVFESQNIPDILKAMPPDIGLLAYDGSHVAGPPPDAPVQAARKWRSPRETAEIVPINEGTPT